MNIGQLLEGKEICVVAGSGGVGKTTTSASIAIGMAARGHRVAVLTIDPAKRLADSLGLSELGTELSEVDPALFTAEGIDFAGELHAAMLDPKRTFDELIESHAPDRETYEKILDNRIYQELSNAVAGSQEYMAMEKLLELHEQGDFDLLVLDTPPSRNALDFLDAPKRLARFIEGRSLRLFLAPGRFGLRIAGRGGSLLFGALKRVTGIDLLKDLSEFFGNFADMASGFSERAQRVDELLHGQDTTFVLVCSPEHEPADEAIFLRRRLRELKLPFGGAIVNKVRPAYHRARKKLPDAIPEDLAARVMENYERQRLLGRRDAENVARLEKSLGADKVVQVPLFGDDIHGVEGLVNMVDQLFPE
ncbi:MAG TPA: ArsA-related P-loop ATPase [Solirubrobacterales bacterium]|jgi:anion-transporting  ArsA/GET3 family ATPase|nr:ArsA-related P-loop ATPase [Solirubrobacterales bacterium]